MHLDVPRKGNVDRNSERVKRTVDYAWTFPARGTWIEISCSPCQILLSDRDVPRKGNVDRNKDIVKDRYGDAE